MTVPATPRKAGPYAGNGVTTQFPFTFKVFDKTNVQPVLTDANGTATNLVLDSDYSVLLNADQDANPGGTITYPALVGPLPMPAGSTLTMIGSLSYDQLTDITNTGRFLPDVFERSFDKAVILIQQIKEISDRTLQAAIGTTVKLLFPAPSSGKFIRWRSDLLGLENVDAGTDSMALQGLLADAVDPVHGSYLVGFLPTATGAVGRTLRDHLSERLSVKDFGAKGDDVTNDTAAIQAAINAVGYGVLYFPPGNYRYTTLTLPKGCALRGAGRHSTVLKTTSATGTGLLCTDTLPYEFSDLQFAASVTRTAGDFIRVLPASGYNGGTLVRRCSFPLAWNAINFVAANAFSVENCAFQGHLSNAIVISNTATPDAGDSSITGCIFDSSTLTASHITQTSSGGLRIINNKLLRAGYHYSATFNSGAGASTSILLIQGNSSEAANVANFALNSASSTPFSKVIILGNQLSVGSGASGITVQDPGYVWLDDILISGNNIAMGGGAGVAINIARANRLSLGSNQIVGNSVEAGIIIGANVTNAIIAPQDLTNILTPWSGAGLANPSVYFSPGRRENGSVSASTTTAYGGGTFCTATQNIVFAQPFGKAPSVQATALETGTGISAVVSNITASGFSMRIVGMTNSVAVQAAWTAQG